MRLDPERIAARRRRRNFEARVMQAVMASALGILLLGIVLILAVIIVQGLPAVSWQMLTDVPRGGTPAGAKGGILNSIVGSVYLAVGGTILSFFLGLPIALYLNAYQGRSKFAWWVRLVLDVLWGIPSLLYGAFGFAIMLTFGLKASLLAGI